MRKSILYFTVYMIFVLYQTTSSVDENDSRFNTVEINIEDDVGHFGTAGIVA